MQAWHIYILPEGLPTTQLKCCVAWASLDHHGFQHLTWMCPAQYNAALVKYFPNGIEWAPILCSAIPMTSFTILWCWPLTIELLMSTVGGMSQV